MKLTISSCWTDDERRQVIRAIEAHCDELMRVRHHLSDGSPESIAKLESISEKVYGLCELMESIEHDGAEVLERFRYRVEAYVAPVTTEHP